MYSDVCKFSRFLKKVLSLCKSTNSSNHLQIQIIQILVEITSTLKEFIILKSEYKYSVLGISKKVKHELLCGQIPTSLCTASSIFILWEVDIVLDQTAEVVVSFFETCFI